MCRAVSDMSARLVGPIGYHAMLKRYIEAPIVRHYHENEENEENDENDAENHRQWRTRKGSSCRNCARSGARKGHRNIARISDTARERPRRAQNGAAISRREDDIADGADHFPLGSFANGSHVVRVLQPT